MYTLLNPSPCTSVSLEYGNSSCKPEAYTGSVCATYLIAWQNCVFGTTVSDLPVITTLPDQDVAEEEAMYALSNIGKFYLYIL